MAQAAGSADGMPGSRAPRSNEAAGPARARGAARHGIGGRQRQHRPETLAAGEDAVAHRLGDDLRRRRRRRQSSARAHASITRPGVVEEVGE